MIVVRYTFFLIVLIASESAALRLSQRVWRLKKLGKNALSVASISSALLTSIPGSAMAGSSSTEEYLPRKLYPGTYKNFCGPTPEVSPADGCAAHGWHGDQPEDIVDEACALHDRSYCRCDSEFRQRTGKTISMLASQAALRFMTGNLLLKEGVDVQYLTCIDKADKELIKTGLTIRSKEETLTEAKPEDEPLRWFRERDADNTLARFEKVNLRIFLASLDADSKLLNTHKQAPSLSQLEARRSRDLEEALRINNGIIQKAASDPKVVQDDARILSSLESQ